MSTSDANAKAESLASMFDFSSAGGDTHVNGSRQGQMTRRLESRASSSPRFGPPVLTSVVVDGNHGVFVGEGEVGEAGSRLDNEARGK